jgi:hypothetical protein
MIEQGWAHTKEQLIGRRYFTPETLAVLRDSYMLGASLMYDILLNLDCVRSTVKDPVTGTARDFALLKAISRDMDRFYNEILKGPAHAEKGSARPAAANDQPPA